MNNVDPCREFIKRADRNSKWNNWKDLLSISFGYKLMTYKDSMTTTEFTLI